MNCNKNLLLLSTPKTKQNTLGFTNFNLLSCYFFSEGKNLRSIIKKNKDHIKNQR